MKKETICESKSRQPGKKTFIYETIKKLREKENIEWNYEYGAWIGKKK